MVWNDTEEPWHSVAAIWIHVTFRLSTYSGVGFDCYAALVGTFIEINMSVRYKVVAVGADRDADVADGGADSGLASLNVGWAVVAG